MENTKSIQKYKNDGKYENHEDTKNMGKIENTRIWKYKS